MRKMSVAAFTMGIIIYYCNIFWFHLNDALEIRLAFLLGCISLGILVYALISHFLKNEEWLYLLEMRKNKAHKFPANLN